MASIILRYWQLKAHNACYAQRELFKEIFGYKVSVNKRNLLKAYRSGLDIFWFMCTFISWENYHDFSAYMGEQWYSHKTEITYDFEQALNNIINRYLSYGVP